MKYTKPQITYSGVASLAIQGSGNKVLTDMDDNIRQHSTTPAYSADE